MHARGQAVARHAFMHACMLVGGSRSYALRPLFLSLFHLETRGMMQTTTNTKSLRTNTQTEKQTNRGPNSCIKATDGLQPCMVQLYIRNLLWNTTKEQLRSFLWRYATVDTWQPAASLLRDATQTTRITPAPTSRGRSSPGGGALDSEVCS